jgi:hypothetical protein
MQPIGEVRDRILNDLRLTVWRPSIRSGNADASEVLLQHLLEMLCFIDGREAEWEAVRNTYIRGCDRPGVKWVHFDLARRLQGADDWLPNPLVRDFRDGVSNQMYLLPVGLRWAGGS